MASGRLKLKVLIWPPPLNPRQSAFCRGFFFVSALCSVLSGHKKSGRGSRPSRFDLYNFLFIMTRRAAPCVYIIRFAPMRSTKWFSKRLVADSSNPQPFPFKKLKELCSANIGIISGTQWVFSENSIHSLKYAIAFSGSESMW